MGVFIYRQNEGEHLSDSEKKVMNTACKQIAMYVNRMQTGTREKETEELQQIEKVHGMLIERFSLLFGKPIERAKKAVEALKGTENQSEQIKEIENSLETVSKTFSNVSAMSQLIEGLIPLEREKYRPDQIALECCESVQKTYPATPIDFVTEGVIPVANLDYFLIKILIYNVLIYSVENSKPGSKVVVRLKGFKNRVILTCLSHALEEVKESDLFANSVMGLTFAKTIAEVHGGSLTAEIIDGSKILFTFTIPLG
jgi:K+-sensing histidine kinase KdpD